MKQVLKSFGGKLAAGVALVPLAAGSAFAAVPESVTTALAEAKTDAVSVAGLVIAIIVAIMAFVFMRRAMR